MSRSIIQRLQRRELLQGTACGFGAIAAKALAADTLAKGTLAKGTLAKGTLAKGTLAKGTLGTGTQVDSAASGLHHAPKAKRVIFLFMQGGVSQVDSFDYKPALAKHDGKQMPFDDARTLANTGMRASQERVFKSPWKFQRYGETGRWASELFPKSASHMDDLCMLHAMHTEGVAHGPATLFLHCGSTNFIRPSMGSWVHYALGSENQNLPGFVSISPSIGNGGPRNYGSAFLPAKHQGTPIGSAGSSELTIDRLLREDVPQHQQQAQLALIQQLNRAQSKRHGKFNDEFEAVMDSYEMAWRMQSIAPEILDLESESAGTRAMYGLNSPVTESYGKKCLLARRLCESGVRFIQVNYGDNSANPAWDQHSNLPKHAEHAAAVDQPISALLTDLKQRGLLEDTIVWWGGEFGRTPYSQNNGTGRDHNPGGFTVWLAGGGFKPGYSHGETDEFGFAGVQGKVHMHDLHATILHQLGIDHEQLTYQHAGRDFRLTDVYGRVVDALLDA